MKLRWIGLFSFTKRHRRQIALSSSHPRTHVACTIGLIGAKRFLNFMIAMIVIIRALTFCSSLPTGQKVITSRTVTRHGGPYLYQVSEHDTLGAKYDSIRILRKPVQHQVSTNLNFNLKLRSNRAKNKGHPHVLQVPFSVLEFWCGKRGTFVRMTTLCLK